MSQDKKIVIVDYGAGNLRSVVSAVSKLGYCPQITSRQEDLADAEAVIMPGVGAAAVTMANLRRLGLVEPIRDYIADDRPFLGVCMGLQVLFTYTEEGGGRCLDIIRGRVKKLPQGLKIPHIGWNQVCQRKSHPVFRGIADSSNFYFVHSYYVEPVDKSLVVGETEYGVAFCSIAAFGNVVGTQFHPEKSGETGLKLYQNFIDLALARD